MRFSSKAQKVMVLIGDAPPHAENADRLLTQVAKFARQDGHFHTIFTKTNGFDSRGTGHVQGYFASLASKGGGRSIELTDDARQHMHDWLRANHREQRPTHEYRLDQFGFDVGRVDQCQTFQSGHAHVGSP